MSQLTISTELIRRLRHHAPSEVTDYRDRNFLASCFGRDPQAFIPGGSNCRIDAGSRSAGSDEVALSDARDTAQQRRAQAALGHVIPTRKATSEVTLRDIPRRDIRAVDEGRVRGTDRTGGTDPAAFRDLLI